MIEYGVGSDDVILLFCLLLEVTLPLFLVHWYKLVTISVLEWWCCSLILFPFTVICHSFDHSLFCWVHSRCDLLTGDGYDIRCNSRCSFCRVPFWVLITGGGANDLEYLPFYSRNACYRAVRCCHGALPSVPTVAVVQIAFRFVLAFSFGGFLTVMGGRIVPLVCLHCLPLLPWRWYWWPLPILLNIPTIHLLLLRCRCCCFVPVIRYDDGPFWYRYIPTRPTRLFGIWCSGHYRAILLLMNSSWNR